MEILINTNEKEITFIEGDWSEIIDLLKTYNDFTVIDERFEEVGFNPFQYPTYPTYINPGTAGNPCWFDAGDICCTANNS